MPVRTAKTGRKRLVKGVTTESRKQEVADLYAALEEWKKDQEPAYIAEVTAKFDGYSESNALLLAMQMPAATDVDSRSAWLERNRVPVGTGTALKIVRPGRKWTEDNPDDPEHPTEHASYYVWRGVFDVSVTIELPPEEAARMLADHRYTAPQVLAWRKAHPEGTW